MKFKLLHIFTAMLFFAIGWGVNDYINPWPTPEEYRKKWYQNTKANTNDSSLYAKTWSDPTIVTVVIGEGASGIGSYPEGREHMVKILHKPESFVGWVVDEDGYWYAAWAYGLEKYEGERMHFVSAKRNLIGRWIPTATKQPKYKWRAP